MTSSPSNPDLSAFLSARDFLLQHRTDYEFVYQKFRWPQLTQFNWALDYFGGYARDNQKTALWIVDESGLELKLSYDQISRRSNQVANFLRKQGVRRGDRIIVLLPNVVAMWEVMFLLERGIIFNRGPLSLRKEMPYLLEDGDQNLTPSLRTLLRHLWQEWQCLNDQIDRIGAAIEDVAESDVACQRLRKIPGVGPLVSTATVAAIGNGAAFRRGRDFAAWLGLVPKQHSTGGKATLLGITKRGNKYLRKLFVHGARAVLLRVKYDTGGFGQWVHRLAARAPRNKVIIAIANKLARIAWVVLSSGNEYQH